jgi:hypothetical protein
MNSIVCVGDGDGLYGEQWNLSCSANFQIKLAPLILYTTLVYTSTLKSTV